jgi:alpha,alpha-trehalose phosphorylase
MGTVLGVDVDAILFDLDGVLTPTAELHRLCWRDAFTSVCPGTELTDREYLDNIDGRPRLEGVRAQLHAWGYDTRDDNIVAAVAERKDAAFTRRLDADGMRPYPGSAAFLDAVETDGIEIAVVSSSRNARRVLHAAGLATRFSVVVDGVRAVANELDGKPAPDMFLAAAADLGCAPERCAVIEDATSGVLGARAARCEPVIGVDRGGNRNALLAAGSSIVVHDLSELLERS